MDSGTVHLSGVAAYPAKQTEAGRFRPSFLHWFEGIISVYAAFLILGSIAMFMMGNGATKIDALIASQNDAAIKLWTDLDYNAHHPAAAGADLPPGLFAELVTFSRGNATILKAVHRLSLSTLFAAAEPEEEGLKHLTPKDGKTPPTMFDHIGVDPSVDAATVGAVGFYQIELYQAVRDYAQDKASLYTDVLSAVTRYIMPVLYALLGAALWTLRVASQREPDAARAMPDQSSRFIMAAIAGIAISSFHGVIPSDATLSPLAVAFVCGYAIEVFTSRLDRFIAGFSKPKEQSSGG